MAISPALAIQFGCQFALVGASFAYMFLYYRRHIINNVVNTEKHQDIHTKIIRTYPQVPDYIYLIALCISIILAILTVVVYRNEFQLHWWATLLSISLSLIFIIPVGITKAISNTSISLNFISEIIIGFIQPGNPTANLSFKAFATSILQQSLLLLSDLKLGLYMKIPPRHVFICQTYGTLISCLTNYIFFGLILTAFPDILSNACIAAKGPASCPQIVEKQWSSPKPILIYTSSLIWGLIGPQKLLFESDAPYWSIFLFFPAGIIISILFFILHRKFRNVGFHYISFPIIFQNAGLVLEGYANAILSNTILGLIALFVRKYHRSIYDKYVHILSASLDTGSIASTILIAVFYFIISKVTRF